MLTIESLNFWTFSLLILEEILLGYGGVYAVPTSILINKKGESIFSYPGAILKSYDRYDGVYTALNNKIDEAIKEKYGSSVIPIQD